MALSAHSLLPVPPVPVLPRATRKKKNREEVAVAVAEAAGGLLVAK
jgi:hypothetical protein